VSFAGSRYFVFRQTRQPIMLQASKFAALYGTIVCMHYAVRLDRSLGA